MRNLDSFIADAEATSRKYWIASILIGAIVMCLAYQKRRSVILVLAIAGLVFHPHFTVRAFPMPSCDFISVQASEGVLALLVLMLGYLAIKTLLAYRRAAQGK